LSGDALAESQTAPEQLFEIQEVLATLGFFDGEADGEFGPLTRAAIRRYQKANGLPQNNFLTIAQSKALLEGQTARSTNAGGSTARAVLSQETPPQSPPQQQPVPARRALAEQFAEPPKQYSIVEVANESRACRPAFSNNCITLEKGERVVVLAWQIDDKPRRGLYCLRPMGMSECYYADLTAIEINGVPVPTIGLDKPRPAPGRRVEGTPSTIAPMPETPTQSSPPQPAPAQRAENAVLPGQSPSSTVAPSQETRSPMQRGERETPSPLNGTWVGAPGPHSSSGAPDTGSKVDQIIRSKCQNEWPNDFEMRVYCEGKQREGVQTLAQGRPKDVQEDQFTIIRRKCGAEWPDDFGMRAYCEGKQYEAVRQLQRLGESESPAWLTQEGAGRETSMSLAERSPKQPVNESGHKLLDAVAQRVANADNLDNMLRGMVSLGMYDAVCKPDAGLIDADMYRLMLKVTEYAPEVKVKAAAASIVALFEKDPLATCTALEQTVKLEVNELNGAAARIFRSDQAE
jgi:peptidoglycan hydrolase-like protein with peptidoglycan-binding domain